MRITEKQNGIILLIASIRIVDDALTCGQAYLVEILAAINFCGASILFNLKYIEPF
jgi:hypothetical protein